MRRSSISRLQGNIYHIQHEENSEKCSVCFLLATSWSRLKRLRHQRAQLGKWCPVQRRQKFAACLNPSICSAFLFAYFQYIALMSQNKMKNKKTHGIRKTARWTKYLSKQTYIFLFLVFAYFTGLRGFTWFKMIFRLLHYGFIDTAPTTLKTGLWPSIAVQFYLKHVKSHDNLTIDH